jgi:hypothetical protein
MTKNRWLVLLGGVVGGWLGYVAADLGASLYFTGMGGTVTNGWRYSTEWGAASPPSLKAAAFAKHAMFGNTADEAVYYFAFADGTAGNRYVIHFDAGDFPDVSAFWSLTMYHGDLPYNLVANSVDRWVISDRTPGIEFNDDGSLDIWIQHEEPQPDRLASWLPAPDGPLLLLLRTYGPGEAIREGSYAPPPLTPTTE